MEQRTLGTEGLRVSAQGLGCMGMSEFYGSADEGEAVATIHRALDLGITLLDTSDIYGPQTNEQLVGRAIEDRRDEVVLATKFGILRDPNDPSVRGVNGRPDYVHQACAASPSNTSTSTTSTASTPTSRSRRRWARWPSWSTPARSGSWDCLRRPLKPSAALTPCTRSAPCRPSTRCGPATSRRRCCPRSVSSASGSSPTARLAAGFSRGDRKSTRLNS